MMAERVTHEPAPVEGERDDVRLGMAIGNAVLAAVSGRNTAYVGRTWGDLKRAIELLGVRDDDALASIEYGVIWHRSGLIALERDEHGSAEIREVRG